MIPGARGWRRVVADISLGLPLIALAFIIYWWFDRLVRHPATLEEYRLVGPNVAKPGDVIEVEFYVIRHKTCKLEIDRILHRVFDKREFLIQFVVQTIEEDGVKRRSGYKISIPPESAAGYHLVYSRTRYYCTAIDLFWPNVWTSPKLVLEIIDGQQSRR